MPLASNTITLKRINREIEDLDKEDLGDMTLEPSDDNMFIWKASIPGPEGSPYEGGVFHLKVELAPDYPFTAPKATFITRIYHMNVSDRGNVCIDILKQNWSAALSLYKVMLSLSSLLTDPNPKDPLVPAIAAEYVRNRKKHDNTAREWTRLYAQRPTEQQQRQSQPSASAPPTNANAKGKGRAAASSARAEENGRTRRTTRTTARNQAAHTHTQTTMIVGGDFIDLSDMDDRPDPPILNGVNGVNGVGGVGHAARTRAQAAGAKRKRGSDGTDESESSSGQGQASRKRRISASVERVDDVIVIED